MAHTAVLNAISGQTLTAKMFTLAAPTTVYKTGTVAERANALGQYVSSFTGVAANTYTVILFLGTLPVAIGLRTFTGVDGEVATQSIPLSVRQEIIALLAAGTEVFGHSYLEAIKRIEMVAGGATLSGAGSGTEVMRSLDLTKTATFTVDANGNVSGVAWS